MGITFGDYLIDSGYYEITPEQERERDMSNENLLRLADNIAAHGSSITYPSRGAAQEVRNVVRELAAVLRATSAEQIETHKRITEAVFEVLGSVRDPFQDNAQAISDAIWRALVVSEEKGEKS
jgi:hypothetical protein